MIGATVPTIGGLHNAFEYAEKWECDCIQIYLTASRRWNSPPLSDENKMLFIKTWQTSRVKEVISHVPFLVNIASPDRDLWEKSKERLIMEVNTAADLGVRLLVLHPGSPRDSDRKTAILRATEAINYALASPDAKNTKILIETMAGQGTVLCSVFEELAEILNGIDKQDRVGICFDTAHVFAAGYDLTSHDGYKKVIEKFDAIVGVRRIDLFHINDSKTGLGSRHDRHTYIGEGEMGSRTFQALLQDPRFDDVPKILELPGRGDSIKSNLRFIRRLTSKATV